MSQNGFTQLYPSVWKQDKQNAIMEFAEGYKAFLDTCKTERETAAEVIRQAEAAGYENLDELCAAGKNCSPATKCTRCAKTKPPRSSRSENGP